MLHNKFKIVYVLLTLLPAISYGDSINITNRTNENTTILLVVDVHGGKCVRDISSGRFPIDFKDSFTRSFSFPPTDCDLKNKFIVIDFYDKSGSIKYGGYRFLGPYSVGSATNPGWDCYSYHPFLMQATYPDSHTANLTIKAGPPGSNRCTYPAGA